MPPKRLNPRTRRKYKLYKIRRNIGRCTMMCDKERNKYNRRKKHKGRDEE